MQVRILISVHLREGSQPESPEVGTVVDVDDDYALDLIAGGIAERVGAPERPTKPVGPAATTTARGPSQVREQPPSPKQPKASKAKPRTAKKEK